MLYTYSGVIAATRGTATAAIANHELDFVILVALQTVHRFGTRRMRVRGHRKTF